MDPLLDLLGLVILVAAIIGAAALGLVLLGLLNAASGGGVERAFPIPPGFTQHTAEIEARLRAHYLKRPGFRDPARASAPSSSRVDR